MSELNTEALEKAFAALKQGLLEHEQYPQLLTVRDGVIQRFEMLMDLSRQILVRFLKEKFYVEEARAKQDTFREAAKLGLIADAEAWLGHLTARNRTSHTYDSAVANAVFATIPSFVPDVQDLLNRLQSYAT